MGTIRQMLNQNLLVSMGLLLYVSVDLNAPIIDSFPILKPIGAWLIFMGAGIALYNRFTNSKG